MPPKVKVYSTTGCQYCRLLKAWLERNKIAYENIDVGRNPSAAREMVEMTGQYSVPVTVVDNEVVIGFDAVGLSKLFGTAPVEGAYDVIIIGGGPAGLTAAMYCARKMLRTIVITENIGGQALESWAIENYMGYRMVTGEELMQKFETQVREEKIRIELDSVSSITGKTEDVFSLKTVSEQEFTARSIIITSGVRPRWLGLPDEERFIGRGMSICSTCDGPLFKDKRVAIVGGGNYALTTAIEMSRIASEVFLIVRSKIRADEVYLSQYRENKKIKTLMPAEITGLHGTGVLEGITLKNTETGDEQRIELEGLFLAIGHRPNTRFLDGFVETNDHGEIKIDINCHTSREGIFAAGDVTDVNGKQVIIASGEGAKAALEVYAYLMKETG